MPNSELQQLCLPQFRLPKYVYKIEKKFWFSDFFLSIFLVLLVVKTAVFFFLHQPTAAMTNLAGG